MLKHTAEKTFLFAVPRGRPFPTKGELNLTAEIFLNEAPSGVGDRPALIALRTYTSRVRALIEAFP
jgi:hypothetical protein